LGTTFLTVALAGSSRTSRRRAATAAARPPGPRSGTASLCRGA